MMTTKGSVGIRELKEDAPELVRRAARGERFVITRYGKPAAVLIPYDQSAEAASPALLAWQKEKAAFEALSARTLERFRGRYVAVHRGKLIDSDLDVDRLSERVWKKLRGGVFYVARVGEPPETVEITGFELE